MAGSTLSNIGMIATGGASGLLSKSGRKTLGNFFFGTPEKHEQISTLLPEQQPLLNQLQNSAMNRGAGGAFGTSADYYRDLMSNESPDYQAFAAPEMRNFNENIIPGLSEQFAGFGSGALNSSGFRNATANAGVDLAERLGAIRANLRQQGAQGLQNIGQFGLNQFSQDRMTQPGTQGFLSTIAPAAGNLAAQYAGMKMGMPSGFGQTQPYGNRGGY
mgnify:CR=1 FL=1